ncbi:MAG: polysaccharide chain length determinant protein (PEP-CTERM system associated) [Bacteroidia bacterium]|jgi:polysaccharide chain length determinant protein (PEP-CTERM system associated)
MQEILAQVLSYLWGVWRHRWLALAVAWVIAIVGWLSVWQMPEAYVARARVYVDTNTVLRPLLEGLAIQPDHEGRIGLVSRTLLSRPNLEKLMRMTDLDLEVTTAREKDELLGFLAKTIRLSSGRTDKSLYSIYVANTDRDTAKRIAQALITVFIETSLSGKREDASGAHSFLDEKLREYEQRMIASETRKANFRQKNIKVLGSGGKGGGYYKNLNSSRSRLKQSKLSLREEENRLVELQRQLDGEEPMYLPPEQADTFAPPRLLPGPAPGEMSPIDAQIIAMYGMLNTLSLRYTDRHPQVRLLKLRTAELEVQKEEETRLLEAAFEETMKAALEAGANSEQVEDIAKSYAGLTSSPVYLNMRKMLGETKAKVAGLRTRVTQYEEEVKDLEGKVNTIPEVEGQLRQLDRDIGVIKGQHSALLKRRELARLGQDVEQKASDVTFRVIDPPYVPMKPSEPNKPLLNAIVLGVGIAAGIAISLLVSLISPVIFDARQLMSMTGLPVLGSVSINLQAEEMRKERFGIVMFSFLSATLLLLYLGMTLGQTVLPSS